MSDQPNEPQNWILRSVSAYPDPEDWDELERQPNVPKTHHVIAGSVAGVCEHIALFPVDTLRTRTQALSFSGAKGGALETVGTVWKELGAQGFFRGSATVCFGCIPAHAALFGVYEWGKTRLDTSKPLEGMLCGGMAQVCHDTILTPSDVVKQRLQLGCYKNASHCVSSMTQSEGVVSLFRSLPASVLINVPYGAFMVATNEWMKHRFDIVTQDKDLGQTTSTAGHKVGLHFAVAGVSGAIAGFLTTPLDVVRTRLQTQECYVDKEIKDLKRRRLKTFVGKSGGRGINQGNVMRNIHGREEVNQPRTFSVGGSRGSIQAPTRRPTESYVLGREPRAPRYTSVTQAIKRVWAEEGVRGFWRVGRFTFTVGDLYCQGALVRSAVTSPSAAICWGKPT
eukprot:GHVN01005545.1.p1 GENE.GHVN01005545.1~~GHVN01005545.1.p1  ORF type:complete len:395 (+),score=20.27 GHVN01005545.1:281-1465(+)